MATQILTLAATRTRMADSTRDSAFTAGIGAAIHTGGTIAATATRIEAMATGIAGMATRIEAMATVIEDIRIADTLTGIEVGMDTVAAMAERMAIGAVTHAGASVDFEEVRADLPVAQADLAAVMGAAEGIVKDAWLGV